MCSSAARQISGLQYGVRHTAIACAGGGELRARPVIVAAHFTNGIGTRRLGLLFARVLFPECQRSQLRGQQIVETIPQLRFPRVTLLRSERRCPLGRRPSLTHSSVREAAVREASELAQCKLGTLTCASTRYVPCKFHYRPSPISACKLHQALQFDPFCSHPTHVCERSKAICAKRD